MQLHTKNKSKFVARVFRLASSRINYNVEKQSLIAHATNQIAQ